MIIGEVWLAPARIILLVELGGELASQEKIAAPRLAVPVILGTKREAAALHQAAEANVPSMVARRQPIQDFVVFQEEEFFFQLFGFVVVGVSSFLVALALKFLGARLLGCNAGQKRNRRRKCEEHQPGSALS